MYRSLNAKYIVETIERLGHRIVERFPDSSLSRVARELHYVATESAALTERLRRPFWLLRIAVLIASGLLIASVVMALSLVRIAPTEERLSDLLQAVDAAVNEIIVLSLALFFLLSVETRLKRNRALRALHKLRSLCHVIDMHQLTKDPHALLSAGPQTASSPQRALTPFQLARYLDYCSELLSLASKLAALHVQYLRDPVVLNAVNDVESLAGGLSQKIWQKIDVLETRYGPGASTDRSAADSVPLPAADGSRSTMDAEAAPVASPAVDPERTSPSASPQCRAIE